MDASFDLPDSTDWIPTSLPTFEPLEAALRCEVCKEFYTNPVITSCAHTFCSICIRRCIATDGKCPACKSACSADKLIPNIAVREVVNKFQEARPKALELARADKEELDIDGSRKKRKLSETDLQEGEPDRQTRSRQTRSSTRRAEGTDEMPIEVPDSEDDGDTDFLPDGLAKCPICQAAMKEELVFTHLDKCPGPNGSQGRNTLAKKTTFPTTLQRRHREPSPPPTRLSQLNYAMLKEASLRKKLQELRIPNWGSKDLMKRRHIEWLNIYNANCDADANMRKTKTQMLAELDEWETTQGGRAGTRESRIMRKDFNGSGHASIHRSQFDDLIANARKARAAAKQETEEKKKDGPNTPDNQQEARATAQPAPADQAVNPARPYEGNEADLASIREKVEEANRRDSKLPSLSQEPPRMTSGSPPNAMDTPTGIQNPLGSPSRKVPMFSLPEDPIVDVENSTAVQ